MFFFLLSQQQEQVSAFLQVSEMEEQVPGLQDDRSE